MMSGFCKTTVWISMALAVVAAQAGANVNTRDIRLRQVVYSDSEVYRLAGYIGYQIDLQFEPGETFVGLGAGDVEGLSFAAQDNHLFLKPKATKVRTNLTVLTNRRQYQFDYAATARRPDPRSDDVVYALQFIYPPLAPKPNTATHSVSIDRQLDDSAARRLVNFDYWYCGSPALRPIAASDDGVRTRLRFGARNDLPVIFVRNEDGSESLLNFSMDSGDVLVHRVARGFVVRRGGLTGCIVNKGFSGGGDRLNSGTVAPDVERIVPGLGP